METVDGRRFSPSIGRNREVVREALLDNIAHDGTLLEIGSGTGEHGAFTTQTAKDLIWTYTDYYEDAFESIHSWIDYMGTANLRGPYRLDASAPDWGKPIEAQRFDAVFSANVTHISPFAVTRGIFAGAARLLKNDGKLLLYGPYAQDGEMAEGNANFDADLKRRNSAWGVRDIERDIRPIAREAGFNLALVAGMPANNFTLVFERA